MGLLARLKPYEKHQAIRDLSYQDRTFLARDIREAREVILSRTIALYVVLGTAVALATSVMWLIAHGR